MKLKQLVVAAAAVVASTGAQAAVINGEMILNVIRDDGFVFTQDTGLTLSALRSDAATMMDPSVPLAVVNLDPALIDFITNSPAGTLSYAFLGRQMPPGGQRRSIMATTADIDDGTASNGFENAEITIGNRPVVNATNNANNTTINTNTFGTHSSTDNGTSLVDVNVEGGMVPWATPNVGASNFISTFALLGEKSEIWYFDTPTTNAAGTIVNLNAPAFVDQLKDGRGFEYNGFFRFGDNGLPTQFVIKAVPEPSTWALMALGLLGVGAIARRRGAVAK